jgi:hypothetical protein
MNYYIKSLIKDNKEANIKVKSLERTISTYVVEDEKSKVNYGNLIIALKGFRMIAEATECMLINEDVLKTENGEFYEKIKTDTKCCCNCKTENGTNPNEQNSSNNN